MTLARSYSQKIFPKTLAALLSRLLRIDLDQYLLLLRLFRTLNKRQDLAAHLGLDASGVASVAIWYFILSGLLCLPVLGQPRLETYTSSTLAISVLMLLLPLVIELTDSLVNPREALILASYPVAGFSYNAAKLTHLIALVSSLMTTLNFLPALAGLSLKGTNWFYPIGHILAANLIGFFLTFLLCALYGWTFRLLPPGTVRRVPLWLQLGIIVIPPAWPLTWPYLKSFNDLVFGQGFTRWNPWLAFASVAWIGQSGASRTSDWYPLASGGLTLAMAAIGMRALSQNYLLNATESLQEASESKGRERPSIKPRRLIEWLTGGPPGRAAFAFTLKMMGRDWQFRRQVYPALLMAAISTFGALWNSKEKLPFAFSGFSPSLFLPHVCGYALLFACALLDSSDDHQGGWIFLTASFAESIEFARGIWLAFWLGWVLVPHLLILGFAIWFWGLAEALLFVAFSLAAASVYLSLEILLVEGLPFSKPPNPRRGQALFPVLILVVLATGGSIGLEWLLFRSRAATLAATVALALMARMITRFSLNQLKARITSQLAQIALGSARMFAQVE